MLEIKELTGGILRMLKSEDALFMLEWMHDKDVVSEMQYNFMDATLEDCYNFIEKSKTSVSDVHLAIQDDSGEYMGTVSLKHIDTERLNAEFAIAIRRCAMGTGLAKNAMREIIRYGFEALGLKNVYWYVSRENKRAIRFYDKNGYQQVSGMEYKNEVKDFGGCEEKYIYYIVSRDEVY